MAPLSAALIKPHYRCILLDFLPIRSTISEYPGSIRTSYVVGNYRHTQGI
jgi:hypothetical protein